MKPLLITHPGNLDWLKHQLEPQIDIANRTGQDVMFQGRSLSWGLWSEGIEVRTDAHMSRWVQRRWWEFPKDRFVEYGPEDEDWCRFFGFGFEAVEDTDEPLIICVDRSFFDMKHLLYGLNLIRPVIELKVVAS